MKRAFANTEGGYIILGVKEDKRAKSAEKMAIENRKYIKRQRIFYNEEGLSLYLLINSRVNLH